MQWNWIRKIFKSIKCAHSVNTLPFVDVPTTNIKNMSNLKSAFRIWTVQQYGLTEIKSLMLKNLILTVKTMILSTFPLYTNEVKSKSLSFRHLNISSLDKHQDELNSLYSSLHHYFNFIGISETRIVCSSCNNLSFPN